MKIYLFAFLLVAGIGFCQGQSLYVRTFGNKGASPLLFIHGGPGYNCASFEATTARRLADSGFFVIVYDRRGEGRSRDSSAAFTFQQTFADINQLLATYSIKKLGLIGHSFGGIVATLYAARYPERVSRLFLVSAPVSLQETFKNIIRRCRDIYQAKNDTLNLSYIKMFDGLDSSSLQYSSYCFMHAMQNGFYSPKEPIAETKAIYSRLRADSLARYTSQMTIPAPNGFWKNEHYTTLNLTASLQALLARNMPIYGLYGKDDGLYSPAQVNSLEKLLGPGRLLYLDHCSHSVFIDQQSLFIDRLLGWSR